MQQQLKQCLKRQVLKIDEAQLLHHLQGIALHVMPAVRLPHTHYSARNVFGNLWVRRLITVLSAIDFPLLRLLPLCSVL